MHVGQCRISPDHNFLAYTLDATGSEQFMLQIKDLRTGCLIPRAPVDRVVSLAWAQDCQTLFYTVADENQRPYRHTSSLHCPVFFLEIQIFSNLSIVFAGFFAQNWGQIIQMMP